MAIGHKILTWMERSRVRHYISRMTVGQRVTIKTGLRVKCPRNVTIGDDVRINNDFTLQAQGPITIGGQTMIATGVTILTANHDTSLSGIEAMDSIQPSGVSIGSNCWLGARVIVLPGVSIGDGTVVGAGSVVVHDLPPGMVCVGTPARPVKPRPKASEEIE
jgi:acetyltransferase-like isoleucine patch superfamily enzyme